MAARSPAVLAIVVINVVFFLAQRIVPGLTIRLGAVPAAIAAGEWYRLLTPMLLHHPGNLLHILFNMIVLWIYGPYVEQALGTARFVAVYVVSGFCGGAVSFAFGPCQSLGVGASGAIFGVVGALLVHLYRRRRSSFVAGYLRDLTFFIGINLVFGFVFPGIDYLAHVGGLVAGATIGGGFDLDSGERKSGVAALTSLAVVGAGVALVAWRTGQGLCV
jgi:membrane associated rhomboid family serine protease